MPAIDRKFVEKLETFTNSLEEIVSLLKEETKKDNTDVVNKMIKGVDDDRLSMVVNELKDVKKDIKSVKTDTESIKKSIAEIKKSKETGFFDRVRDPDNKEKIIEGVKVITLIAGGVLSIGAAFKLIGKVDPASVVTLSLSIVALSGSFVMISKNLSDNNLTTKDILKTTSVLPIMAGGLVLSSVILSKTVPIGTDKLLSIVAISASMGIALYAISRSMDNVDIKGKGGVGKYLMLPIILPAISAGIALSSVALSMTKTISPLKLLSVLAVSAVAGGSLYLMSMALSKSKIRKKDLNKFFYLPVVLPLISTGIMVSSWILSATKVMSPRESIGILMTGTAIGLTMMAFVPTVYLLGKLKRRQLQRGIISVPLIAGAIALSSHILSYGDYTYYPGAKWTLFTGLSLIGFGGVVYLIGKFLKKNEILKGTIGLIALAGSITAISHILSAGDYSTLIPVRWGINVGISLLAFGGLMYLMNKLFDKDDVIKGGLYLMGISGTVVAVSNLISLGNYSTTIPLSWGINTGLALVAFGGSMYILGKILKPKQLVLGGLALIGVATVILASSKILSYGEYDKYPSIDWVKGVGLSMLIFGGSMAVLGIMATTGVGAVALLAGGVAVMGVAGVMIGVSSILSKYNWKSAKYPSEEWSRSVGMSLMAFSGAMLLSVPGAVIGSIMEFFGSDPPLIKVAKSMVEVGKILGGYDKWNKYPSVDWSKGVGSSLIMFSSAMLLSTPGALIDGIFEFFGSEPPLVKIAKNMIDVASVLGGYDWDSSKFPSEKWALGVGTSLTAFTLMSLASTPAAILDSVFSFFGADPPLYHIADQMISVAKKLNEYDWSELRYPSSEWAEGVGKSITYFSAMSIASAPGAIVGKIMKFFGSKPPLSDIAEQMISVAKELNKYDWKNLKHPDKSWAEGVGMSLTAFSNTLKDLDEADIKVKKFGDKSIELIEGLVKISEYIKTVDFGDTPKIDFSWTNNVTRGISTFINMVEEIKNKDISKSDYKEVLNIVDKMNSLITDIENIKTVDINKKSYENISDLVNIYDDILTKLNKIGVTIDSTSVKLRSSLESLQTSMVVDIDVKKLNESLKTLENINIYESFNKIKDQIENSNNILMSLKINDFSENITLSISHINEKLKNIEIYDISDSIIKSVDKLNSKMSELRVKDFSGNLISSIDELNTKLKNIEIYDISNDIISMMDNMKNISSIDMGINVEPIISDIKLLKSVLSNIDSEIRYTNVLKDLSYNMSLLSETIDKIKVKEDPLSFISKMKIDLTPILSNIDEFIGKYDSKSKEIMDISMSISKSFYGINDNLPQFKFDFDNSGLMEFKKSISGIMKDVEMDVDGLEKTITDLSKIGKASSELESLVNVLSDVRDVLSTLDSKSFSIRKLSDSLSYLGRVMDDIDQKSMNMLDKFANGMLVLSYVNEEKLENVLDKIYDDKDKISSIMSADYDEFGTDELTTSVVNKYITTTDTSDRNEEIERFNKLMKHIENIDRVLVEILGVKHVDNPNKFSFGDIKESNSDIL